MTVAISPATEEEVQSGEIGRRLREFNYTYVGEYPATEYIRLNALWVDEAARGRGIGSRLLTEAERLAREMGARNAALETFEWQAPKFYLKHGYEEYARIDDYAPGFYLACMRKSLVP